jgi:hypothetical protein
MGSTHIDADETVLINETEICSAPVEILPLILHRESSLMV